MLTLPLYSSLLLYATFLLGVLGFFIVNIGNLARTGTFTFISFLATFFFLTAAALIVWGTWQLLQNIDWQQPVTLWNSGWISALLGKIFPASL